MKSMSSMCRRVSAVKAIAAAVLCAWGAGVQALQVVDWYPIDNQQVYYLGNADNWTYLVSSPCGTCEGGVFLRSVIATSLGGDVRGVMHDQLDAPRGNTFRPDLPAHIGGSSDVTLDSLHVLSSDGERTILREAGSTAKLALLGASGVPLVVGTVGGAKGSTLRFLDTVMSSSGSALVHPDASMTLDRSLWSHAGQVVVGASALTGPAGTARLSVGNSTVAAMLGQRLELIVGSAAAGTMWVSAGAGGTSSVEANVVTVGGETQEGLLTINGAGAVLRATDALRMGRGGATSRVEVLSGGRLQASYGQIGFLPDTLGGTSAPNLLEVLPGSSAEFRNMNGDWRSGRLDVGTSSLDLATGMKGYVHGFAGSLLSVENDFNVGGRGTGTAWLEGDLVARRVSVGGSGGAGQGTLMTRGLVTIGERAVTPPMFIGDYERVDYTGQVRLDGQALWSHGGNGVVHGGVEVGAGGDAAGKDTELRLLAGSTLSVDRQMWAGTSVDGAANQVRVVVEQGATLKIGDAFDRASAYPSANLLLQRTATLSGGGTVDGNVYVDGGTVAPGMSPGWLTILGNLTYSASAFSGPGKLVIELGDDASPGITYDVLEVLGLLDLGDGAALEVRLLEDFDPTGSYNFLRFGSLAGNFGALNVVDMFNKFDEASLRFGFGGAGFGLNIGQAAVPEPGALALALLALAALGATGRRRRGRPRSGLE